MRKAKARYFREKIDNCSTSDPKKSWKLINTLLGKHHKANQYVNELHVDGSVLSELEEIAEAFNDYFVNIGPNLANECPGQSSTNDASFLDFCEWNSEEFSFDKISVQNVALTLKSLKASKATGLDKIPAKILKVAADSIAPSLTFILQPFTFFWNLC